MAQSCVPVPQSASMTARPLVASTTATAAARVATRRSGGCRQQMAGPRPTSPAWAMRLTLLAATGCHIYRTSAAARPSRKCGVKPHPQPPPP